jgi:hypothetical protein
MNNPLIYIDPSGEENHFYPRTTAELFHSAFKNDYGITPKQAGEQISAKAAPVLKESTYIMRNVGITLDVATFAFPVVAPVTGPINWSLDIIDYAINGDMTVFIPLAGGKLARSAFKKHDPKITADTEERIDTGTSLFIKLEPSKYDNNTTNQEK